MPKIPEIEEGQIWFFFNEIMIIKRIEKSENNTNGRVFYINPIFSEKVLLQQKIVTMQYWFECITKGNLYKITQKEACKRINKIKGDKLNYDYLFDNSIGVDEYEKMDTRLYHSLINGWPSAKRRELLTLENVIKRLEEVRHFRGVGSKSMNLLIKLAKKYNLRPHIKTPDTYYALKAPVENPDTYSVLLTGFKNQKQARAFYIHLANILELDAFEHCSHEDTGGMLFAEVDDANVDLFKKDRSQLVIPMKIEYDVNFEGWGDIEECDDIEFVVL